MPVSSSSVVTMQYQKTGWSAQREISAQKKIVLSGDSPTIEALRATQWLKLRLICENGSSLMVTLDNKRETPPFGEGIKRLTATVSRIQLEEFFERDLEVIFWDSDREVGVAFRAVALSKDAWLSEFKPLCEPRN